MTKRIETDTAAEIRAKADTTRATLTSATVALAAVALDDIEGVRLAQDTLTKAQAEADAAHQALEKFADHVRETAEQERARRVKAEAEAEAERARVEQAAREERAARVNARLQEAAGDVQARMKDRAGRLAALDRELAGISEENEADVRGFEDTIERVSKLAKERGDMVPTVSLVSPQLMQAWRLVLAPHESPMRLEPQVRQVIFGVDNWGAPAKSVQTNSAEARAWSDEARIAALLDGTYMAKREAIADLADVRKRPKDQEAIANAVATYTEAFAGEPPLN